MDNACIVEQMKKTWVAPEPAGKEEFFLRAEENGLLDRRPTVITHREFLAIQLFYIEKRIWVLSGFLLLFLAWICSRNAGNYPFALTPLLAAGILSETGRSGRS